MDRHFTEALQHVDCLERRLGDFSVMVPCRHFLVEVLGVTPLKPHFVEIVFHFCHITPWPLLINPVHHSLTTLPVNLSSPHQSPFKALLTGSAILSEKNSFALLGEVGPISPQRMLICKQSPLLLEPKTLLPKSASQPVTDL